MDADLPQRALRVLARAEHAHFKDSRNLNERNRTSFAVQLDSIDPVIAAGLAMAIDVDGSEAIPGFRFHATPGHSPYHASIAFESDGRNALFAGDVLHHPVQVHRPTLNTLFDAEPEAAVRSRAWALDHACERDAQVFSSHFPGSSTGRVRGGPNGYRWVASDATPADG